MRLVSNISNGPRGVWIEGEGGRELVMLEAGQSRNLNVAAGEESDDSEWFTFADPLDHDGGGERGGSLAQEPPALTGKTKAQLLEIASEEGVEIEDGSTNADIISAIELAREAVATA